jgi:hypothetical protein
MYELGLIGFPDDRIEIIGIFHLKEALMNSLILFKPYKMGLQVSFGLGSEISQKGHLRKHQEISWRVRNFGSEGIICQWSAGMRGRSGNVSKKHEQIDKQID